MTFDLDAYLSRIGVSTRGGPTPATLDALIWGHLRAIPFENLDIVLGRPIKIDLHSVATKLVTARRGGYCFEHNTLFAEVLRAHGFEVTALAARVRWGAAGPTPRTHMFLEVVVDGRPQLVDVGFGGTCPTRAVPMQPGVYESRHGRLRLRDDAGFIALDAEAKAEWEPLYMFTREPHHPIDFEVANHYTSTHPQSRFTLGPSVALTTDTGRITYRAGEFTERVGDRVTTTAVTTASQLLDVLGKRFELVFPPHTQFIGGPTESPL
ncbi:MAG: arylamine N-acetyltransferase [Kofleriaceae bacterium]